MLGRRVNIFRLLGFQVQVDTSWLILAFLVTWSLATGYFPLQYVELTPPSTGEWASSPPSACSDR
jgi:hypothetical protein